jgi:hypothetical protein
MELPMETRLVIVLSVALIGVAGCAPNSVPTEPASTLAVRLEAPQPALPSYTECGMISARSLPDLLATLSQSHFHIIVSDGITEESADVVEESHEEGSYTVPRVRLVLADAIAPLERTLEPPRVVIANDLSAVRFRDRNGTTFVRSAGPGNAQAIDRLRAEPSRRWALIVADTSSGLMLADAVPMRMMSLLLGEQEVSFDAVSSAMAR